MKDGSAIKAALYVFIVITLIHIGISMAIPVSRFNSGFSYSTLMEADSANSKDTAPFPPPMYVAEKRVGMPDNLRVYSFIGGQAQEQFSRWYVARGDFYIMTGGFPFLDGNAVQVEVQSKSSMQKRFDLTDKVNSRNVMAMRKIYLNRERGPYKVRIVAKQSAPGSANTWFAVSEPFIITGKTGDLMSVLRIVLSVFAAVTLILGPGLALRTFLKQASIFRAAAFIAVPGVLILAICGLTCWKEALRINPQFISAAFSLTSLVFCFFVLSIRSATELVSNAEWKVIGVVFIVVLIAAAKGSYSVGPFEEMYGCTISRTLDAGGRPDSRIQYHVVQLAGNGLDPYSRAGSKYFYPWSFSSRTPMGGLTAASLVFLAGGMPPPGMPSQAWVPFDNEGFAVYRIAMIVLSAACLLAMFSVASALADERAGYFCVLLTVLTPFFIHEVYYSWPKLAAAGLVMAALYTVLVKRPRLSGLFLGLGYLFHPMALFSLPVILFVLIAVEANGSLRDLFFVKYKKMLLDGGIIVITCGIFLFFWEVVNVDSDRQAFFLQYILMSNEKLGAGPLAWFTSRLQSLANTVVPLYLYIHTGGVQEVNSLYGRVPNIIPFCFQYWNTVPFGFGLVAAALFIKKTYDGARVHPIVFTAVAAVPFFAFAVYWGFNVTGLMPEGLHVWVMSVLLFMVWAWRPLVITRGQSIVLSLRGIEVLIMLIAPVWFSMDKRLDEIYYINDIVMLCVMFGGTALLAKKTLAISSC
ncbi:MAG: hypothetical protein HQK96_13120 [Nitrospirae bacterium]|nr:hypothetical protein [Nitrospirota bacterium]